MILHNPGACLIASINCSRGEGGLCSPFVRSLFLTLSAILLPDKNRPSYSLDRDDGGAAGVAVFGAGSEVCPRQVVVRTTPGRVKRRVKSQ